MLQQQHRQNRLSVSDTKVEKKRISRAPAPAPAPPPRGGGGSASASASAGGSSSSSYLGGEGGVMTSVRSPSLSNALATTTTAAATEANQRGRRELARRQQTAMRRGLFSASELIDWMGEEYPGLDKQCIIRFPPAVAALLRERLSVHAARNHSLLTEAGRPGAAGGGEEAHSTATTAGRRASSSSSSSSAAASSSSSMSGIAATSSIPPLPRDCAPSNPLGLIITPTRDWGYRLFDVKVSGYKRRLVGVLVELPTLVETYKTLDGDLFFKSGDIAQMIVVYDPTDPAQLVDVRTLCERQQWEWKAGLTPPTHRIRSRKFKNIDLFDRQEVRDAELQVLELLHSTRRDTYDIELHTMAEMLQNIERWREEKAAACAAAGDGSSNTDLLEGMSLLKSSGGTSLVGGAADFGSLSGSPRFIGRKTTPGSSLLTAAATAAAANRVGAGGGGGGATTPVDGPIIEHIISCDDDVLAWLDDMGMGNSEAAACLSDYSDCLFEQAPTRRRRWGGGGGSATTTTTAPLPTTTTTTNTSTPGISITSAQPFQNIGANLRGGGGSVWTAGGSPPTGLLGPPASTLDGSHLTYGWSSAGVPMEGGVVGGIGGGGGHPAQQLQQQDFLLLQQQQQQRQEGGLSVSGMTGIDSSLQLMESDETEANSAVFLSSQVGSAAETHLMSPDTLHHGFTPGGSVCTPEQQQQLLFLQQQQAGHALASYDAVGLEIMQTQQTNTTMHGTQGSTISGAALTPHGGVVVGPCEIEEAKGVSSTVGAPVGAAVEATVTAAGSATSSSSTNVEVSLSGDTQDDRLRKKLEKKQKKILKKERRRMRKEKKQKKEKDQPPPNDPHITTLTAADGASAVLTPGNRAEAQQQLQQQQHLPTAITTSRSGSFTTIAQARHGYTSAGHSLSVETEEQDDGGSSSPSSSSDDEAKDTGGGL